MGREAKGFNPFKEGGAQKVSPSLDGGHRKFRTSNLPIL